MQYPAILQIDDDGQCPIFSLHVYTPLCVCLCAVKLNGGRTVTGILRGFDPYMNIVMDDTIEERSSTQKYKIGMVVGGVCVSVCVCGWVGGWVHV